MADAAFPHSPGAAYNPAMSGSAPFKDHFSAASKQYAAFRPTYPSELAEYLATLPAQAELAWDNGCGSGQLSTMLALHFQHVEATDASAKQIAGASPHARITYRQARAEASGLPDQCVDLAVSSQAAHWYDIESYYCEVRRVARPGAIIALVAYGRSILDADIAPVFDHFYDDVAGSYWPPERTIIEGRYRTLAFPFAEIAAPEFDMHADWNLSQLLGYIDTWSALRGLEKARGRAPFEEFSRELARVWGDSSRTRRVCWPLTLRAGHIDKS